MILAQLLLIDVKMQSAETMKLSQLHFGMYEALYADASHPLMQVPSHDRQ
jgi:hypothetical protein